MLGEQLGRRAPAGLFLEIEIGERLPGIVADDQAGVVVLFDRPRWREAARGGQGAGTQRLARRARGASSADLGSNLRRRRSLPLPAPAKQTHHAEAGGEQRQHGREWSICRAKRILKPRRPRLRAWIASVFLLLQLIGKQIHYFLSI
jgi:hypothetical protein